MSKKKYDIFVSYRRTAFDTASLIAEKLRNAGYRVFFDVDTLTGGKFNEQLLEVISDCNDFILVLSENALDRCNDAGDWVRRETMCAIEHKKNIIPVMLDGFTWPQAMPQSMEELQMFQSITATSHEYFDMAIQRLIGYLKSTPTKPLKRWLTKGGVVLGIIVFVLVIAALVLWQMAKVYSNDIGKKQAEAMNTMNLLNSDERDLNKDFEVFLKSIDVAKTKQDTTKAEDDFETSIAIFEKNMKSYRPAFNLSFEVSALEAWLLSYYKIEREELRSFASYYDQMFNISEEQVNVFREFLKNHSYSDKDRAVMKIQFSNHNHSMNAFYYGYLGAMSLLPQSARKDHYQLARKWDTFPNGIPLDLSQEEYEQFQMNEFYRLEQEVNEVSAMPDEQ